MGKLKYFGTDGIRGRVGVAPITPDFMLRLGWAAGRAFASAGGGGRVVIGKDTRLSGYMFESVLEAGLSSAGMDVRLLGVVPTPAIAYLTRTFRADAGIVISASHNPHYDNGIKFFSPDGAKLPEEVELSIERLLDEPMVTAGSEQLGRVDRAEDARGRYIEFCKASVPRRFSLGGLRVVLDCAHGATSRVAFGVFDELGAEVILVGAEPNGLNINEGCGATHTEYLAAQVVAHGADVGIAFDGDGDRVMMVDHVGQVADGDEILYMIARYRQTRGELGGGVVGTMMSNLGLERALESLDVSFARSKVGDRFVLEVLKEKGWVLGGENSGHVVCLDRTTTGDGIIAALQVLEAMMTADVDLRTLRMGMQKYPQIMVNVAATEPGSVAGIEPIRCAVREAEDLLGSRGRVLLRPSGTEPVVRVMVEGENEGEVSGLVTSLAEVVREHVA